MTKLQWKDKWTDKEIDYFRKSTKKADDESQIAWWALFGTVVLMEVIFAANIIGLF